MKKEKRIWRVVDLLQWITKDFESKGIESSRLDAELILSYALKLDRVQLYINFDRPVIEEELKIIRRLVTRRRRREPIAYIIGKKEFYSIELKMEPGVFIPRPETEILVDTSLKYIKRGDKILDIGIGSGAISIALAKNIRDIKIIGIDINEKACILAKENIERYNLSDIIEVRHISMERFFKESEEKFDIVVSNPPYVPTEEIKDLMPEIKDFEPREAIDGGKDGISFIKKLIKGVKKILKGEGRVIIEIGDGQLPLLKEELKNSNFIIEEVSKDLAKKDRVIVIYHI